ncbi:MAG TPA: hypothetical protein DDY78_10875 [Planctomycetales bacterium]|jgi:hypothetical protein|nr:hypothetical protein [Planctomycetales bacterium]
MRDQQVQTKAVVSVAEMARMCSLSRARFYQLMKAGTFPQPDYDPQTGRPFYTEELQRHCLEVRRRNCGVDGRPVLFYARGNRPPVQVKPTRPTTAHPTRAKLPKADDHADLLDGLAALGLTSATALQVGAALRVLYPSGVGGVDGGDVLRAVFLNLKRQNTGDNVGR